MFVFEIMCFGWICIIIIIIVTIAQNVASHPLEVWEVECTSKEFWPVHLVFANNIQSKPGQFLMQH